MQQLRGNNSYYLRIYLCVICTVVLKKNPFKETTASFYKSILES